MKSNVENPVLKLLLLEVEGVLGPKKSSNEEYEGLGACFVGVGAVEDSPLPVKSLEKKTN